VKTHNDSLSEVKTHNDSLSEVKTHNDSLSEVKTHTSSNYFSHNFSMHTLCVCYLRVNDVSHTLHTF